MLILPLLTTFLTASSSLATRITLSQLNPRDSNLSPLERSLSAKLSLESKYSRWTSSPSSSAASIIESKRLVGQRQQKKKRKEAEIALENIYSDATWLGTISVGTPAQDLLVILDTGSSDLWLSSESYSASASSSLAASTKKFEISYGSGSASGTLATDVVSMGSFSTSQTFGYVTTTTSGLIFSPITGIMGLAWSSLAQSGANPFWLNQISQFTSPLFAFYLARTDGSTPSTGGECTLGYTNPDLFTGDINYVSLPSGQTNTYWIVTMDDIEVGGSKVGISSGTKVAIDTGTTLIVGPASDVEKFWATIDGSKSVGNGQYAFPCTDTLEVSFVFGGVAYALESADLSRGLYETGSSLCIGSISSTNLGGAPMSWIIGGAFLKNVYTVFRHEPAAIGFARLSDSAGGSPEPAVAAETTATTAVAATSTTAAGTTVVAQTTTTTAATATSSAAADDDNSASASASASSASSNNPSASSDGISTSTVTLSSSTSSPTSSSDADYSDSSIASIIATTTEVIAGTGGIVTGMIPEATSSATTSPSSSEDDTSAGTQRMVVGGWMVGSVGFVLALGTFVI